MLLSANVEVTFLARTIMGVQTLSHILTSWREITGFLFFSQYHFLVKVTHFSSRFRNVYRRLTIFFYTPMEHLALASHGLDHFTDSLGRVFAFFYINYLCYSSIGHVLVGYIFSHPCRFCYVVFFLGRFSLQPFVYFPFLKKSHGFLVFFAPLVYAPWPFIKINM